MARYRCVNCAPRPRGFVFEADKPECPRCGAKNELMLTPMTLSGFAKITRVQELEDIHLLVEDIAGPIPDGNTRRYVACQPERDELARNKLDRFHASTDPRAVTCRSCMTTPAFMAINKFFLSVDQHYRERTELDAKIQAGMMTKKG
jgi:hypothetical protein